MRDLTNYIFLGARLFSPKIIENVGGKFDLSFRLAISFGIRNASTSNARAGIEVHELPGIWMKSDKRVGYKFRAPLLPAIGLLEEFFSTYHALDSASQEVVNEDRNVVPTQSYKPTSHRESR